MVFVTRLVSLKLNNTDKAFDFLISFPLESFMFVVDKRKGVAWYSGTEI